MKSGLRMRITVILRIDPKTIVTDYWNTTKTMVLFTQRLIVPTYD